MIAPNIREAARPGDDNGALPGDGALRPVVSRRRMALFALGIVGMFMLIAGQLVRLGLEASDQPQLNMAASVVRAFARPDITDRNGQLLATDVVAPSLYADPKLIDDPDATALTLADHLVGLDIDALRTALADRDRRFVWIRRGLTPQKAQEIHDLGLVGLAFRDELRRVYPKGRLAAHILGTVNIDNRGTLGVEQFIDQQIGIDPVEGAGRSQKPPLALSIDLAAQFALNEELAGAIDRYQAKAAAGLVMDVANGELLAAAALPDFDPNDSATSLAPESIDRLVKSRYELGSIMKTVTVAAVLDAGMAGRDTLYDTTAPITLDGRTISDLHPPGRPLSLEDVFIKSSNVGAARMADKLGPDAFRAFLDRLGLLEPGTTEIGPFAPADEPETWDRLHVMTAAFGHGIALSPLQFAGATAALLNGGRPVRPTFLRRIDGMARSRPAPVVRPETVAAVRALMRRNVTAPGGTGKRAAVTGYRIGGKTGTAEIPGPGGYDRDRVIASFLAAVPADAPRFLVLVLLFEPQGTEASGGSRGGGATAAPTVARIVSRVAPILGLLPDGAAGPATPG